MKNINKLTLVLMFLISMIVFQGCQKDALDLKPQDRLSLESTFSNYENIQNYSWQFYNCFPGYERPQTGRPLWWANFIALDNLHNTDLGALSTPNSESVWIWQKVPATQDYNPVGTGTYANYTFFFENIRAINVFLDNIDGAGISEGEKKHWKSVGYFFKAYNYSELIKRYGDITWVENNLEADDKETLFGPRTPRDVVANNILDLLKYAEENINPKNDEKNTINVHVVRALTSRFALFEGTWRKYHGLSDADKYLRACVNASEPLIADFPILMENYGKIFNSVSLEDEPGILLYKAYVENEVEHRLSTFPKSGSGRWDLTRKFVDMVLMRDGQTRWTSPLFEGDKSMYTEFRNRDLRLYYYTSPPYKVNVNPNVSTFEWSHTDNPGDSEYFDLMDSLSPDGLQGIPKVNWVGQICSEIPHFVDNTRGQAWTVSYTGYQFLKYSSRLNEWTSSKDINDCPLFRMGEVMLNYAEAKMELGELNQSIIDMTVNKLRARGGVSPLDVGNITDDPTRDPEIDPAMWEIRRERAIELLGEHDGFRFHDLRRWKKMDYALERKLGVWIKKADQNNRVPVLDDADEGYVSYWGVPPSPFPEHYYLYPIPTSEVVLTNGAVEQNPGW